MTDETYKYCEHISFGVGAAQLVKWRKDRNDDLFMVTFQITGQEQKWFMPRKYFTLGDDIAFISDARATELYKEGRKNPKKMKSRATKRKESSIADILDGLF